MNTLSTSQHRLDHTLRHPIVLERPARTSLPDRIAMRIALALVLWSTRPQPDHTTVARRRAAVVARSTREHSWLRDHRTFPLL